MISNIIFRLTSLYTRRFPVPIGKARIVEFLLNRRAPHYSCLTKSFDGRIFEFDSATRHNYQIFFYGDRERSETQLVRELIEEGDIVIDVGANVGWYTTLLSQLVGSKGKVFAIEPVPKTFDLLKRSVKLNNCPPNAFFLNNLCGNKEGFATILDFPGLHPGLSSERPILKEQHIEHRLEVITLDNLIHRNKLERINFLKLDVEGAELSVLKGAYNSSRFGKIESIMIEVNEERCSAFGYNFQDCIDFIHSANEFVSFKILQKTPRVQKLRAPSDFNSGDNLLFVLKRSEKYKKILPRIMG